VTIGSTFASVLALAQEGDDHALTVLYKDVAPLVMGYLRSNRVENVEDVAGDVFVSMVTSIGGFGGGEDQFHSWLLTITHRRMIDDRRRRTRRREDTVAPVDLDRDGESGRDVAAVMDAGVTAVNRLDVGDVLAAMDHLTPEQREVVMLRVLADLPIRDIAAIVARPETAVRALLRRGVAAIHRNLTSSDSDVAS